MTTDMNGISAVMFPFANNIIAAIGIPKTNIQDHAQASNAKPRPTNKPTVKMITPIKLNVFLRS